MKYIIGLLIIAGLWACSKEDWPDNSQSEANLFAVPAGATGEEAELRRGFSDRTGIYQSSFGVEYGFNQSRYRFFYLLSLQSVGGEEGGDGVC